MVWSMRCARRIVDEERLLRCQRLLESDPGGRLVGHVGKEVVVGIIRQFHRMNTVIDEWCPLIGLAAQEAVKLVESLARRPAIERTGNARLPGCQLVPLAERRSAVAVQAQYLGQRSDILGYPAGVAGKRCAGLDDRAHIVDVMVAPTFQCCTRRRTDGCGVEVVVMQPLAGNLVEGGRGHRTAEGARTGKAQVIDQHDQHIWCTDRRLDVKRRGSLRIPHIELTVERPLGLEYRQHLAVQRVYLFRCRYRYRGCQCQYETGRQQEWLDRLFMDLHQCHSLFSLVRQTLWPRGQNQIPRPRQCPLAAMVQTVPPSV